MSVYKSKKSAPYFWFDFWIGGRRFHGSTRSTNRREAEKIEGAGARTRRRTGKGGPACVGIVADRSRRRSLLERARAISFGADNTSRDLARLVEYFGKSKLLTDISDAGVAKLVATRAGRAMVSNATVNRSTTGMLRTLFAFAKSEGYRFDHEPQWLRHMLAKPEERVRELHDDEAERIDAAMRADYVPFFNFVRATGMRQRECITLRWSEVNLSPHARSSSWARAASVLPSQSPLGSEPSYGHCRGITRNSSSPTQPSGRIEGRFTRGERYPLTVSGVKTNWRRLRKAAGVSDFRFHDFRHDFATKLLRRSRQP